MFKYMVNCTLDTLSVPRFIETTISGSIVADPVTNYLQTKQKQLDEVARDLDGSECF